MPEGDVVLRTARRLSAALVGQTLTRSDLRWPSLATVDLAGWSPVEVVAVGKHLLLRLDPPAGSAEHGGHRPLTLHSHLRMEGSWHVHRTGQRWTARSADGVRVVLETPTWTAVGHRLGMVDLVPTAAEGTLVGHLGVDVLGADWDAERAAAALLRDPGRPVGEALLDQTLVAGIGTFWMAESLFLRGVSPWTPVGAVDRLPALLDRTRRMMSAHLDQPVQATTGDLRPGQHQYVHGRSGRPCRRCGTTVRVAPVGTPPEDRTAFYCPSCQPGPTPTDDGRTQRPLGSGRRRPASRRDRS